MLSLEERRLALRVALKLRGVRDAGHETYTFCIKCGALTENVWACDGCWRGLFPMPDPARYPPKPPRFTLTEKERELLGL